MRILACLLPLAAIAAAPASDSRPPIPITADLANPCGGARASDAELTAAGPLVRRLGDEPGAHQELAVERLVGRCETPIVVRENVGGTSPPVRPSRSALDQTSSTSRP